METGCINYPNESWVRQGQAKDKITTSPVAAASAHRVSRRRTPSPPATRVGPFAPYREITAFKILSESRTSVVTAFLAPPHIPSQPIAMATMIWTSAALA